MATGSQTETSKRNGRIPEAVFDIPQMSSNDIIKTSLSSDEQKIVQLIEEKVTTIINKAFKSIPADKRPSSVIRVIDHMSGNECYTCFVLEGVPLDLYGEIITALGKIGSCTPLEYANFNGKNRVSSAGIAVRFFNLSGVR